MKLKNLKQAFSKKGTIVMFICNHCPFVIHVNEEIVRIANDYRINGFGFALWGRRAYDQETNSYLSTLCFTIIFFIIMSHF